MFRLAPARMLLAAGLALVAALAPAGLRAQNHDPRLRWRTLETAHFRIHYYQGLRPAAERVAEVGEGVYDRLGGLMGWRPSQVTEVVVSDHTDDANGSATAVPYNTMRLYATSPDDLGTLSEYDDWLQSLVTHEFTHIAQSDNISGLPAVINAIFGKVYPPNQVQPRWILEGMAVYSETAHTTGGRLRSSVWDMYMRADALADNFVTLDQLSTGPNRWPHGDIYYLYGSYFVEYLVRRFGEHVLGDVASYYGGQLVPYGVNRAIQRATGFTYEELYPQFLEDLRARYRAQLEAIEARGLREGERLTFHNETVTYPRVLPGGRGVAYQVYDGWSQPQIRTVDLAPRGDRPGERAAPRPRTHDGDWIAAQSGFALSHDGRRMVLSDVGFYRDIYFYRELYERRTEIGADGALRARDNRALTDGARAMYPDLSPDDDHVAFTVNHAGTMTLAEMSLTDRQPRPLFPVRRFEQVYTPRYSPDGRQLVFSHWRRGGFRDIRLLDRASGRITDLTHDRAVDAQPVFSPDGRFVVFSSDRTGIANIYALELATGVLRQVTNVRSGAFMPAITPDGRTLVYQGYHAMGFDLYRMPFDPARWLEPGAERERRGARLPTPPVAVREHAYDPFSTLRPRSWSFALTDDGFGPRLELATLGADVVGNHAFAARAGVGLVQPDPNFDLSYQYIGLRPTLRLHAYRTIAATTWRVGGEQPRFPYERWGGEAEVAVSFPQLFASNNVALSYEAQYGGPLGGVPFGPYVDPSELPNVPPRGTLRAGLRASFSLSRQFRYTYDISTSRGYALSIAARVFDRALGSRVGSFDVTGAAEGYLPMPWGYYRRPHVLATRLAGGLARSDAGPQRIFGVGGFPAFAPADFLTSLITLSSASGVALRGYPQFARQGDAFVLANAEYRFPIVQIDRGPVTLPVYLTRLYGNVFCDAGNAWNGPVRLEDLAVGVGAELLADVVFGFVLPYTVRLGIARGLRGPDAQEAQGYALFSAPF